MGACLPPPQDRTVSHGCWEHEVLVYGSGPAYVQPRNTGTVKSDSHTPIPRIKIVTWYHGWAIPICRSHDHTLKLPTHPVICDTAILIFTEVVVEATLRLDQLDT